MPMTPKSEYPKRPIRAAVIAFLALSAFVGVFIPFDEQTREACLVVIAASLTLSAPWLGAAELSVEDFRFAGPLGSEGARIEKLDAAHFRVTLSHAPDHPDWANNCQFEIVRHAKGNPLRLDVKFEHPKPQFAFDEYFHSWSYDGRQWQPIRWKQNSNGKQNRLLFPTFEQDRVLFGLPVPLSHEDATELLAAWAKHPHAVVHDLGTSLGGRKLQRLEMLTKQDNAESGECLVQAIAEYSGGVRR